MFTEKHVEILRNGGIGVIPTDTLYGVVGMLGNATALEKIKAARHVVEKPNGWVTLISAIDDLQKSAIDPTDTQRHILEKIWPGPFSVGFGNRPGAYRLPAYSELREFLEKTGPLLAPSANITNEPPASNIDEAKAYFGEKVDFYIDSGILSGEPSTVIIFEGDRVRIVREGAGDISLLKDNLVDIIE